MIRCFKIYLILCWGCGFAWKKTLKSLEKNPMSFVFKKASNGSHCFFAWKKAWNNRNWKVSFRVFAWKREGLEISPGCLVRCRAVPAGSASGCSSTRPDASQKYHGLLPLHNPAGHPVSYVTFGAACHLFFAFSGGKNNQPMTIALSLLLI